METITSIGNHRTDSSCDNGNPYPCYINASVPHEQFIPEHLFVYLIAGTMTIFDGNKEYHLKAGDYCFARRNYLAKYMKKSPAEGEFKATSILFKQDFLRRVSQEYGYQADGKTGNEAIMHLKSNSLLEDYLHSLSPYIDTDEPENEHFLALKHKEIILILLKTNPELKNVLFDFSEPGKIDLESFMQQNFRFNISLKRFGYLTGRSLTTFKRDFQKIFKTAPGRWLLQKRLDEAYYLIQKRGQKPSHVYLEVGFEDLSHFSYAFKKAFGIAPSRLIQGN
ncbi:helix-turn-helix domain-containing protein [Pedobacter sp. AW31-3R]|uniref:helix-turn-helix domain-containing protein n=1 Tax=Pedobacter sp. AW31-3R TaxID=3445781 RepID=UPI003F9F16BB